MNISELPAGPAPQPLTPTHFPTRWQAFLWRNWGLVPPARLAEILCCAKQDAVNAAADMGLPPQPEISPKWLTHGYLTLIRRNWHLLPYEQLLRLLNWPPEKMAYTLKEEDFLWAKMGRLKPQCEPVLMSPLTPQQKAQTEAIRKTIREFFPSEEMSYQDRPFSFIERFAARPGSRGKDKFEFNFIHSYSASCGDVLGNADRLDPVPENLLQQYASMGIQGVWMHAQLYLLNPIPGAEEFSRGYEQRLQNLQKIIDRCGRYGIKVYLYMNEPRCMPLPFYDIKPEWAGISIPQLQTRAICTTRSPEPLQWLESSMQILFTKVHNLGGVFSITMSENPTHCHYDFDSSACPTCSMTPPENLIAGVITAMERGMHRADPDAKMIVFDWMWMRRWGDTDNAPYKKKILDLLPKNIILASDSEWGLWTEVGGIRQYLMDYSISQVGPSDETLAVWEHAHQLGIRTIAKIQINNSWELSAVPYLPVPYLIQEHLSNLQKAGAYGLMLSWTLGGYPGGNLDLISRTPEEIAAAAYHPELADQVCRAWKIFSEAFRLFPFNVLVIYVGPMNFGPMNLLRLKSTGYKATMIGFPYDDLKTWRGPYPEEVLEEQFRKLTEQWRDGLKILETSQSSVTAAEEPDFRELLDISWASYCHFRSAYLQIRFVRARNQNYDKAVMTECAREEIDLALRLHDIHRRDSRIGFEASNHYFYTLNDLQEKVLSCRQIIGDLNR